MLAVGQRLRRRSEFAAAVRSGRRVGRGVLVVHLSSARIGDDAIDRHDARAGFIIPRSVGSAVARNKVRRRLRHLMHDRLIHLPSDVDVVIRALPGSAECSFDRLRCDLDAAIAAARTSTPDVRHRERRPDRRRR